MYKNYDNEGHCSCSNIDRYEARFAHIRLIGAGRNPDTVKVYISPRSAGRGNGVAAAQISPFCVSRACSLRCIRLRGGVAAGAKEADLVPIAFALCSLLVSCAVLSTAPAAESAAPDPPRTIPLASPARHSASSRPDPLAVGAAGRQLPGLRRRFHRRLVTFPAHHDG